MQQQIWKQFWPLEDTMMGLQEEIGNGERTSKEKAGKAKIVVWCVKGSYFQKQKIVRSIVETTSIFVLWLFGRSMMLLVKDARGLSKSTNELVIVDHLKYSLSCERFLQLQLYY